MRTPRALLVTVALLGSLLLLPIGVAYAGPGTTTSAPATTEPPTTGTTGPTTTGTVLPPGTIYETPGCDECLDIQPGTVVPVGTVLRVTIATESINDSASFYLYPAGYDDPHDYLVFGVDLGGHPPLVVELDTAGLEPGDYVLVGNQSISGGGDEFMTLYGPIAITLTDPAAAPVGEPPTFTG